MDMIETKLQEMRENARNEHINRIAVHEAGHFVMMLLLMREAPYHIVLTPETEAGMTVPFHLPETVQEKALIMMAGYAAEQLYDPDQAETGLGDYMYHNDYDNQDFLDLFRSLSGKLTEEVYALELKVFECATDMLREYKSLIFLLAEELKNAERMEMDYNAIENFCREYRESHPFLRAVTFPIPTSKEKKVFKEALDEYKMEQENAIRLINGKKVEQKF